MLTSTRDDGVCCVVHSDLPAPNVTISFSGDSIASLNYSLHCSAIVVAGLVVLPDLKIVSPNSTEVSAVNSSSVDYVFSPVRTSDGGQLHLYSHCQHPSGWNNRPAELSSGEYHGSKLVPLMK